VRDATATVTRPLTRSRRFNPRVPCGTRPVFLHLVGRSGNVSIHASRAGRDGGGSPGRSAFRVSIHASRAGRDVFTGMNNREDYQFQSTRPVRDATSLLCIPVVTEKVSIHASRAGRDARAFPTGWPKTVFQSTRPVRDATKCSFPSPSFQNVSIHASRAGRDASSYVCSCKWRRVSIHASRAGRDLSRWVFRSFDRGFQSTRPVRDATRAFVAGRSPNIRFQSTRPVRDATGTPEDDGYQEPVSIHASRAGRDRPIGWRQAVGSAFQSTRPVRDATKSIEELFREGMFQSTRPVRDATLYNISILKILR